SSFSPPTSGSPSSWITYKNYDSTPVNFVWSGGSNASAMFYIGGGSFPSGPAYLEFRGLNLNGNTNPADGFFCRGSHHLRFISNNIISDEVDQSTHHTDVNGIILDLSSGSYDPSTANTPPALILNNVVYGNGGRCIVAYVVTNFWIVNNTCFKNDLDTSESSFGSFEPNDAHDGYLINNIAVAYTGGHPPYEQGGTVTNVHYYADLYFGAANNFSYSDPSQFLQADPLFLNPPSLSAGGYANALLPS